MLVLAGWLAPSRMVHDGAGRSRRRGVGPWQHISWLVAPTMSSMMLSTEGRNKRPTFIIIFPYFPLFPLFPLLPPYFRPISHFHFFPIFLPRETLRTFDSRNLESGHVGRERVDILWIVQLRSLGRIIRSFPGMHEVGTGSEWSSLKCKASGRFPPDWQESEAWLIHKDNVLTSAEIDAALDEPGRGA